MKLGDLLEIAGIFELVGDPERVIRGIAYDSRKIGTGYLFVALKGHTLDGHNYLQDAVRRGATAVVAERFDGLVGDVTRVRVPDSRKILSDLAMKFYGYPFRGIDLVGITGTNGKTTTSFLVESILRRAGARPGVIGTINYRYSGTSYPAPVTTPESLDLVALVREMVDGGVTHVIMEVSSHALDQGRTRDCPFRVGVFTNLSRDHLDYHETMEEYFRAKSRLFRDLAAKGSAEPATAVVNMDDPRGAEMARLTQASVVSYGLQGEWDVRADSIRMDPEGLEARLITPRGRLSIRSRLIGEFNLYNLLAACSAALSLGIDLDRVAEGVEALGAVPGRMEVVPNPQGFPLVVDYAHTPDALQKAIRSLRPFVKGRLITVFGCGGDRDRGKRREMGLVAGSSSDIVLVTSDNPRSEEPLLIMGEIEKGVRESGLDPIEWPPGPGTLPSGYLMEPDRREAIRKAVQLAGGKDLILIAGKGHEDYQIIGGARRHFDDREEAARAASGAL